MQDTHDHVLGTALSNTAFGMLQPWGGRQGWWHQQSHLKGSWGWRVVHLAC